MRGRLENSKPGAESKDERVLVIRSKVPDVKFEKNPRNEAQFFEVAHARFLEKKVKTRNEIAKRKQFSEVWKRDVKLRKGSPRKHVLEVNPMFHLRAC